MSIENIMSSFLEWIWGLITGVAPLVEWLFTSTQILGYDIAPIWLIGGGAGAIILIAGILRAIL